jgi:hypothetical protein
MRAAAHGDCPRGYSDAGTAAVAEDRSTAAGCERADGCGESADCFAADVAADLVAAGLRVDFFAAGFFAEGLTGGFAEAPSQALQ